MGYHLTEYISSFNNEVIFIGRSSYYMDKLHISNQFYEADLFEVEEYECHISTNCIVIHAANKINSTNDFNLLEHHDVKYKYKSFIRLVNVCEKKKIGRFVFLSSAGTVYGNPLTDIINEEHILKPVNIYGLQKVYFEGIF